MTGIKERIEQRLESKYPGFQKVWKEIVLDFGPSFIEEFRKAFREELSSFEELSKFELIIVVDNNFVFGQIKNCVEKGMKYEDTFIYRLLHTGFVNVCAPPKLKDELFDKLETVLRAEYRASALDIAGIVLEQIKIKDAFWIDEWKKASGLIGKGDPDDIPYLALALDTSSHAILSNDKIFKKQGASKAWNISETEQVVTNYQSGFLSFCILGAGVSVIEVLVKLLFTIFRVIGEIVLELITVASDLVSTSHEVLKSVPKEFYYAALGLSVVGLIFSKGFREAGKDAITSLSERVKNVLEYIEGFLEYMRDLIQELAGIMTPHLSTVFEAFGYLVLEYESMKEEVQRLEEERAK